MDGHDTTATAANPDHDALVPAIRDGLGSIAEAIDGLTHGIKTATFGDELLGVEFPIMRISRDLCEALDRLTVEKFEAEEEEDRIWRGGGGHHDPEK